MQDLKDIEMFGKKIKNVYVNMKFDNTCYHPKLVTY